MIARRAYPIPPADGDIPFLMFGINVKNVKLDIVNIRQAVFKNVIQARLPEKFA